jgi:hypothetical protein
MSLLAIGVLEIAGGLLMLMLAIRIWQSGIDRIKCWNTLLGWCLKSWLTGQVGFSREGWIFNFLTLERMKGWIEALIASHRALLVANALW